MSFSQVSSIMRDITFLFLYFVMVIDSLMIKNPGKVRSLYFSNMVERWDNEFNPTGFIGLLKCSERAGHLECLMACSRDWRCTSVTYIPDARICLLSSSDYAIRPMEDPRADFFKSIQYTVPLDGRRSQRFLTKFPHGKAPDRCGMTTHNLQPLLTRDKRIINGYTPLPYNMPWMGALTRDRRSICSVILVSRNPGDKSTAWAITASHCIYKESDEQALDEKKVDYSRFGLLFGVHDQRLATPHVRYRKILKVFRNFEPSDLSLVKLNKAIKFNLYINGLCFPDDPEETDPKEFSSCITCGWGAVEPSKSTITTPKPSNELQCIEVNVEAEKPDHVRRKSLLTIHWHDHSLQGPYKGDSGSPLFCRLIYDQVKFLYGVVTSGASVTLSGLTYFERIPNNLEWINEVMDRRTPSDWDETLGKRTCCFSFKFNLKSSGQRQSAPTTFL